MRRMLAAIVIAVMCGPAGRPAAAEDPRLVGAWKAVTYRISGTDHPMDGVFVLTPRYYAAAIRFRISGGPHDDSNGNSGPYTADGKNIVFTQWVQLHLRPGDKKDPILSHRGPDEHATYTIDGTRLTIVFPSQNRYVLERLE